MNFQTHYVKAHAYKIQWAYIITEKKKVCHRQTEQKAVTHSE